jgi:hypothetical protein
MRIKNSLAVLAGAVALAVAGGAMAQTTSTGANGTIFVNIIDTTNNTSFIFDTGLTLASFADPTSYSTNLATNTASSTAYAAFIAGETPGGGDVLDYSVIGAYTPSSGSPQYVADITSVSAPNVTAGNNGKYVWQQPGSFLSQVNNPAGGATYNGATAAAADGWATGGYEANLTGKTGVSDNAAIGTALNFYSVITTSASSSRGGASVSTFTGQWDLTSAGLLTYTEPSSTVPLPTPLVLMLSGLGLLGLVGRRRQSGFDGAAA